jgi:Listeria/Bacterioides repeat/Listeria/Bacterioides repeat
MKKIILITILIAAIVLPLSLSSCGKLFGKLKDGEYDMSGSEIDGFFQSIDLPKINDFAINMDYGQSGTSVTAYDYNGGYVKIRTQYLNSDGDTTGDVYFALIDGVYKEIDAVNETYQSLSEFEFFKASGLNLDYIKSIPQNLYDEAAFSDDYGEGFNVISKSGKREVKDGAVDKYTVTIACDNLTAGGNAIDYKYVFVASGDYSICSINSSMTYDDAYSDPTKSDSVMNFTISYQPQDVTLPDISGYTSKDVATFTLTASNASFIGGPITVNAGESKPLPEPVSTGTPFFGWYYDSDYKYPLVDYYQAGYGKDKMIYGKWDNSAVSFSLNGGTFKNSAKKPSSAYLEGFVLSYWPSKKGYSFEGWYKDEALTQPLVYGGSTPISSAITLYAKWTTKIKLVRVADGLSYQLLPVFGTPSEVIGTSYMPVKEGSTFVGWYKDAAFTQPISSFPSADATIYAKFG